MTSSPDQSSPSMVYWQAENTHPELIDPFREKMREVIDPELGLNIIELGLIRDLKILEDDAEVTMILTTPFCPYAPAMMEMTRNKAETVLERPVTVDMGMEMWEPSMMEEGAGADWGLY
jgi:metal-sulfur cluster biosynthetic enzyme